MERGRKDDERYEVCGESFCVILGRCGMEMIVVCFVLSSGDNTKNFIDLD